MDAESQDVVQGDVSELAGHKSGSRGCFDWVTPSIFLYEKWDF